MKCATCKVSFAQHELRPYPPAEGESECIGCLYKRLGSVDAALKDAVKSFEDARLGRGLSHRYSLLVSALELIRAPRKEA
jgi:hypothetical protein